MLRQALIDGLHSVLVARGDVDVAILFGSRARGDARPSSDADLAVLAGDLDLVGLAVDLERAVGLTVDVVDLREPPYPLLVAVLRDAVRVFEREPGAYAQFISASLADQETDLPNLRRMQRAFVQRLAKKGLFSTDR